MRCLTRTTTLSLTLATLALAGSHSLADDVVYARHLSLAPNGGDLAFSWAGDIWTAPIVGGIAQRLTVHAGYDSHPIWSRDGQHIAFASRRHGAADVFVMDRDGGNPRRLTFGDRSIYPTDWTEDDTQLLLHSRREGQANWGSYCYRMPVAGGQYWRLMDCFGRDARLSPNGRYIAFTRGGAWWKWWRRRYRGTGSENIWLYDIKAATFRQLTSFNGIDRMPTWHPRSRGVYFQSDRSGTLNVWYQPLEGEPRQITNMSVDDVRDYAISADGKTLVFTHWDKLYVQSLPNGEPRRIHVTAAGDSILNDLDWKTLRGGADEIEVSPDAKEIALVVRGEIFVIKVEEGKPTRRVTENPARDRSVTWSPDGKALFFISDRGGDEQVYRATSAEEPKKSLSDSMRVKIEQVTDSEQPNFDPRVSPDGEQLAMVRERGDLVIRDLKGGEERTLFECWNKPTYQWSPDSEWIAYNVEDLEHNADIWIAPADGSSPPVNISQHPDYDENPQWSADGRVLAFNSYRHGFDTDLYMVFLAPELDELSRVGHDEYFEKCAEAVKKRKPAKSAVASGKICLAGDPPPTEEESADADADEPDKKPKVGSPRAQVRKFLKGLLEEPEPKDKDKDDNDDEAKEYAYELDTAYRRIRRVTELPADQSDFALAPTGDLLVFASKHEGDEKVYSVKWNGKDRKRILSSAAGAMHWDLSGKKLFYLKGGVPTSCGPTGSGAKTHKFAARMVIDHVAEARQKFNDAARALKLWFYHPEMKGLDWPALTAKYRELAMHTRTGYEFTEVFNMFQGELNASHLSMIGGERETPDGTDTSYLGCTFDRDFAGPGLKVASVLENSPADRAESKLVVGDVLLKVGGVPVGSERAIEEALIDQVGAEVIIEFIPSPDRDKDDTEEDESDSDDGDEDESADAAHDADAEETDESETEELVIRPISYTDFANLKYEEWVATNRAYVEQQSDGRVGYCAIRLMAEPTFYEFERDLYAAAHGKDGLIIDVRNNGGGWTADWIMAVLSVKRHAYTIARGGAPGYPQGRLIFYAWTKPATMLCNQFSFSNAEIVSHAFKNTGRGPLVGMTTYGGVISTGSHGLIDGSRIRMPGRGWYTLPDGVDMELNGAEPDVKVPVTPEDEVAGRRPQLDAAIKATLEQL